jgi:hypothetical protein
MTGVSSVGLHYRQVRQFDMPTRRRDTEPPLHLMAAVYLLCLLMLPFVAVCVFGSKCRALVRRAPWHELRERRPPKGKPAV